MQQRDGQRQKHQRGKMRPFAIGQQSRQSPRPEPAAAIGAEFAHQKAARRNQRIAEPGQPCRHPPRAHPPCGPEHCHWTQGVHHGGHHVMRQGRRNARPGGDPCHHEVQQRRIRVRVGDASVPQRKPGEMRKVDDNVARQPDVGGFNRPHVLGVRNAKQPPYQAGIQTEQRQSGRRCLGNLAETGHCLRL